MVVKERTTIGSVILRKSAEGETVTVSESVRGDVHVNLTESQKVISGQLNGELNLVGAISEVTSGVDERSVSS